MTFCYVCIVASETGPAGELGGCGRICLFKTLKHSAKTTESPWEGIGRDACPVAEKD